MKIKKKDIGRFVRVDFDDVGASDGIITGVDGPEDFRFLAFNHMGEGDVHNNGAPAIALGNFADSADTGLDN